MQRERIARTDIEVFGNIAGCPVCTAIRSRKRAQAHSDPCRAWIEECLKTTPEGSERVDRRREDLNEALAKEVEKRQQKRGNRKYSRRVDIITGVARHADPTRLRPEKETCHEGSDSRAVQLQRRRHSKIRRQTSQEWILRAREQTNPGVRKHRTPDDE